MTRPLADRRFGSAIGPAQPAPYVIIADADSTRTSVAVRECLEVMSCRIVISHDSDDIARVLEQSGPPALVLASLSLPGRTVLPIIEALVRSDEGLPVVVWSGDRDVREYARTALGTGNVRLLRSLPSGAALRACLEAVRQARREPTNDEGPPQEGLQDLAERARKRLGVEGAAVYGRCVNDRKYRVAVAWTPDAPMPSLPPLLPAAVEMAIASGDAMVWPDVSSRGTPADVTAVEGVHSLAVVPLIRDGRPAGALCVFDSKTHAVNESDLSVLAALSGGVLPATRATAHANPELIDARGSDLVIRRELARAQRERLSMSVVLFGAHEEPNARVPFEQVATTVARAVRGNDLVIRWSDSRVLVLLTGLPAEMAMHVAERVRTVVEMSGAHPPALSGAVAELRPTDSFEATVTRATERLRLLVRGAHPRIA